MPSARSSLAQRKRTSDPRYNVPNLERGLKLMELLLGHPEGLQQTEIASRLGCAKTSVYRISMTLMKYGYLVRDDETKSISLSRKLLAMGSRTLGEEDLMSLSLDVMRALRDKVKETVLIGAIVETELVVLGQVLGSHHFKFSVDLGTRLPLHAAAPGKAILSMLPADECSRLLRELPFTRFNDRTITTAEAMNAELAETRRNGYAVDRGEQLSGIHCVAAPVLNRHGYPVAAIWVTGPTERIRRSDFASVGSEVAAHARTISHRLGHKAFEQNGGSDE